MTRLTQINNRSTGIMFGSQCVPSAHALLSDFAGTLTIQTEKLLGFFLVSIFPEIENCKEIKQKRISKLKSEEKNNNKSQ